MSGKTRSIFMVVGPVLGP